MEVRRAAFLFLTIESVIPRFRRKERLSFSDQTQTHSSLIMNPRPADAPEPVLLIIADISGYTRYMTANAKTLAHSHAIINELVHAVVEEIELPLEIAKLEGDAIFLFCRKSNSRLAWSETRQIVSDKILQFFGRFGAKLGELSASTTCTCNACTHIERLRLKIVIHSGEALFHRVLNFTELAGVDVIIVHRLLKNSVNASQYLLLTQAAGRDLQFPTTVTFVESAETYEDVGRVNTLVHLPEGERPQPTQPKVSFAAKLYPSLRLFLKLWFSPFANLAARFQNVTASSNGFARTAFAALTLLLTPVFLPVGAAFVLIHAIRSPAKSLHSCSDKNCDGSCGH